MVEELPNLVNSETGGGALSRGGGRGSPGEGRGWGYQPQFGEGIPPPLAPKEVTVSVTQPSW